MYTIRSTSSDISHLAPANLSHDEAARWARSQAKAELMSYGLTVGGGGKIEAEYDGSGEVVAYRVIRNYDYVAGHRPEQELGKVEIVEL